LDLNLLKKRINNLKYPAMSVITHMDKIMTFSLDCKGTIRLNISQNIHLIEEVKAYKIDHPIK